MRHDMDLVRKILLAVEKIPAHEGMGAEEFAELVGGDPLEVSGHVFRLWRGGWLRIHDLSDHGGPDYLIQDMTLEGAEFLNAVRSEGAMAKVRSAAIEMGGGIPLEVAKTIAVKWVREKLGLVE